MARGTRTRRKTAKHGKGRIKAGIRKVGRGIKRIPGTVRVGKVIGGVGHDTLLEAALADAIDVIPIVGDVTNVLRLQNAMETDNKHLRRRRILVQGFDLAVGTLPEAVPGFGTVGAGIADLITPSNLADYGARRGKLVALQEMVDGIYTLADQPAHCFQHGLKPIACVKDFGGRLKENHRRVRKNAREMREAIKSARNKLYISQLTRG